MIIGRLILGIGVGGASVIGPLYISELAPTAVRGRCVGVNSFCIPFGQVIASALGAAFQAGVKPHIAWRCLFALGVIPSLVQMGLLHWLPESPRVLILRDDIDAARNVFQLIYKGASSDIIDFKLQVCKQYTDASTQLQPSLTLKQRVSRYWSHKPYRRAIISVSVVQALGQLTGFNTLLYYSGTIFGLLGLKNSAAAGLIPSGVVTLFVLIGSSLVDRVGRRRSLLIGTPLMMVGLTWACVSFHFLTKDTGGILVAGGEYSRALVGSVLGALIVFVSGMGYSYGYICWYQSEFLALEIRAAGSSIAVTCCWLANLVISVAYLTQLKSLGATGTYGLYLGFISCGLVFVYFCYPETKGLSIDETQSLFEDGFGVKKSQIMLREKQEFASELRNRIGSSA
ncbi:MFS transporter, SP family, solute carrier family 2 (myo-inositol transporter), member 13 [Cryptococcus neoformans Bt85]|nr:MFS transporter, SP family, solute carrier family 2 (myo-inositol transporter), member 13 [Cryptococcus neoformans var. grubii Bt85]